MSDSEQLAKRLVEGAVQRPALRVVEEPELPSTPGIVAKVLANPDAARDAADRDDPGLVWLDPQAPRDNASAFAQRFCYRDGSPEVWFWQGQFWRWNGQCYTPFSEDEIRGQVYRFLDSAHVMGREI